MKGDTEKQQHKYHQCQKLLFETNLQSSRSGRLLKPPLAWWRNQRVITDFDANTTAYDPGTEEGTSVSPYLYNIDLSLSFKVSFT